MFPLVGVSSRGFCPGLQPAEIKISNNPRLRSFIPELKLFCEIIFTIFSDLGIEFRNAIIINF
jgi:hypothetical protein